MLDQNHENRPNIVAVLHHSFFSENKTNGEKSEGKGFIENFKEGIKKQNNFPIHNSSSATPRNEIIDA